MAKAKSSLSDQAPATPKRLRATRRMGAAFGWLDQSNPKLAPSEQAALALRSARQSETWAKPQEIVFLIPMVGPASVSDWGHIRHLLSRTLDSFVRQSNTHWRAIICCQEDPQLSRKGNVQFLAFDDPNPGNDKWRKLAALYGHLRATAKRPGLAMTFDADDLAAPNLVSKLLSTRGALMTHGHIFDAAHNRLALARPQSFKEPGAKAFWKLCGSCAAMPFDPGQASAPEQFAFLSAMSQHEHRMVPYLAELSGTKLASLNEPLALYLLNHGENFGARRGRISFKTRFAQRFEIEDTKARAAILDRYALGD